jgi:hypothetical protein
MQEQLDQTRTGVSNSFGFTGHIRDSLGNCEPVYLVGLNSMDQKGHFKGRFISHASLRSHLDRGPDVAKAQSTVCFRDLAKLNLPIVVRF